MTCLQVLRCAVSAASSWRSQMRSESKDGSGMKKDCESDWKQKKRAQEGRKKGKKDGWMERNEARVDGRKEKKGD